MKTITKKFNIITLTAFLALIVSFGSLQAEEIGEDTNIQTHECEISSDNTDDLKGLIAFKNEPGNASPFGDEGKSIKVKETISELSEMEMVGSTSLKKEYVFNEADWIIDKSKPDEWILNQLINDIREVYIPSYLSIEGQEDIKININDLKSLYQPSTQFLTIEDVEPLNSSNQRRKVQLKTDNLEESFKSSALKKINLSGLDTSNVTNMSHMFAWTRIDELNLSGFDTSSVTDMSGMFRKTYFTNVIDVSSFDTSNVTNMSAMFESAINMDYLDLSNFKTDKVTDMSIMFSTNRFKRLDLSNFDTSNVVDMRQMFEYSYILEELNVSTWDTSKVVDMSKMFYYIPEIEELDLSSFTSTSIVKYNEMFGDTPSLGLIDLSNFKLIDEAHNGKLFYYFLESPLIVISKDPHFHTYNFDNNNRIPFKGARRDAAQGTFSDGSSVKYYNNSIVTASIENVFITPDKYQEFLADTPTPLGPETRFVKWDKESFKDEATDIRDDEGVVYTALYGYEVSFNIDDSVENAVAISNNSLEDHNIPDNPKRFGYTFREWNTKQDGTGDVFNPDTDVITENLVVYAIFDIHEYLVTYDVNGVISTETVLHDGALKNIPSTILPNKIFLHWIDQDNKIFDVHESITENQVLTAIFEDVPLTQPESPDNDNGSNHDILVKEQAEYSKSGEISIDTSVSDTYSFFFATFVISLLSVAILRKHYMQRNQ